MDRIKLHYRMDELDQLQPPYLIIRMDGVEPFAVIVDMHEQQSYGIEVLTTQGKRTLRDDEYEYVSKVPIIVGKPECTGPDMLDVQMIVGDDT